MASDRLVVALCFAKNLVMQGPKGEGKQHALRGFYEQTFRNARCEFDDFLSLYVDARKFMLALFGWLGPATRKPQV
jgi:hypothetical protein